MLEKMMPGMSLALVRVIGVGEALAGFALVLPAAARAWAAVAGWAGAILAAEAVVFFFFKSGEHTSELPSLAYFVFPLLLLKKKKKQLNDETRNVVITNTCHNTHINIACY